MGRNRRPLPPVPLHMLTGQQRTVYSLAANYSTREISQILSISEKQVRQVYSGIRSRSREFANKNVPPDTGAEPVHLATEVNGSCNYDFTRELPENNVLLNLTPAELFVVEQVRKGMSIRQISGISGKSRESVKKMYQRAKKKIGGDGKKYVGHLMTRIDTASTFVRVSPQIIRKAMEKAGPGSERIGEMTGIPARRVMEIERSGLVSYDELFLLIKHIELNPYGPSEKEELLKKIDDVNWIRTIRERSACGGQRSAAERFRSHPHLVRSRYRNRVMYYGTAYYRYNAYNRDRPIIEEGRNGKFPLELSRGQQAECGWLLKRLMLKPVYRYKYPGLAQEIRSLEEKLTGQQDRAASDRYRREMRHLTEDIAHEDGKSIFIITKSQYSAINKILFDF